MWNKNSGYKGFSMSVRASEAYDDGLAPMSKWSKQDILYAIESAIDNGDFEVKFDLVELEKLRKSELTRIALTYKGWHHTSNYCNETDFYGLDEDYLENLTNEEIEEIINSREKIVRGPRKEKPKPIYVTSSVRHYIWKKEASKRPKKYMITEVVTYMKGDKMINTTEGKRRFTSLEILNSIEQKTRFAKKEKLKLEYKKCRA